MKFIGHNSDIIDFLVGDLTLLNAVIKNCKRHELDGSPAVSIMFELAYSDSDVMLTFRNVLKNTLNSDMANGEGKVDSLKFYHVKNRVYLSLDPDESEEGNIGISKDDGDVLLCSSVEGYIFEQGTM